MRDIGRKAQLVHPVAARVPEAETRIKAHFDQVLARRTDAEGAALLGEALRSVRVRGRGRRSADVMRMLSSCR